MPVVRRWGSENGGGDARKALVVVALCEFCRLQVVECRAREAKVSRFGFGAKGRVREPASLNSVMEKSTEPTLHSASLIGRSAGAG
jgi:hypothetical protein